MSGEEQDIPWRDDCCQIAPRSDSNDYTGQPFPPYEPDICVDPVCSSPAGHTLSISLDSAPKTNSKRKAPKHARDVHVADRGRMRLVPRRNQCPRHREARCCYSLGYRFGIEVVVRPSFPTVRNEKVERVRGGCVGVSGQGGQYEEPIDRRSSELQQAY